MVNACWQSSPILTMQIFFARALSFGQGKTEPRSAFVTSVREIKDSPRFQYQT
jgi:hypothetical protein